MPQLRESLSENSLEAVESDIGRDRRNNATNNVAKTVLELVTSIPRERLRANYGHGFLGAPLTTENSQEELTRQDRGACCESTTPEERVGGESEFEPNRFTEQYLAM